MKKKKKPIALISDVSLLQIYSFRAVNIQSRIRTDLIYNEANVRVANKILLLRDREIWLLWLITYHATLAVLRRAVASWD